MKISLALSAAMALVFSCLLMKSTALAEPRPGSWRGQSVTEFTADEAGSFRWQVVNDGVMGGLSKGNLSFTDEGTMVFRGNLSLENNGGFSTVRSGKVDYNLSNDLGLLLRVKGDGRTYEARLDSDARYRGMPVSFAGKFETRKGEWIQVKVPFSSFEGSWRGTDLPDAILNPSVIEQVGILLADKQQGPFEIEIDYIRTYGKGQGSFTERTNETPDTRSVAKSSKGPKRLIDTAVADGRFSTLKKALDAAGLIPFFQWDNPLTVLAPTDDAFAKLPKETLEDLLKPENKDKLVKILSYHVIPGNNSLADALGANEVKTVEGSPVSIAFSGGRVRINDATLIDADVKAKDGMIHVIDTVLLPPQPERKTVLTVAEEAGSFTTLLSAVENLGLTDFLNEGGPFTVFAPTDEAFKALPNETIKALLTTNKGELLTMVVKHHVLTGRVEAGDALKAGKAKTVLGETVSISVEDGLLKVDDSTIRTVNVDGGNGVIHIIDRVLLPKAVRDRLESKSDTSSSSEEKPSDDSVAAN